MTSGVDDVVVKERPQAANKKTGNSSCPHRFPRGDLQVNTSTSLFTLPIYGLRGFVVPIETRHTLPLIADSSKLAPSLEIIGTSPHSAGFGFI